MLNNRVARLRDRKRRMHAVVLPTMVTDLETIFDVMDRVGAYLQDAHEPDATGNRPPISQEYSVTRGTVQRDELASLGIHERNSLTAKVAVGTRWLVVSSDRASVYVTDPDTLESQEALFRALKILLEGGSWRPTWSRLRFLLPLLPLLLVFAGGVWAVATTPLPAGIIVAGIGAAVLLGAVAVRWSHHEWRKTAQVPDGRIRYRAQSRQQTYADRADRRADLKAILITAVVSVGGTLLTGWLTDWFGWS